MSKMDQLRALREERYERDRAAVTALAARKPITQKLRDAVTKLAVTKPRGGRPALNGKPMTAAERKRRSRSKASA